MVVGVTTATPRGANVELQLSGGGKRHFGGLKEEHWSRFGREIIFTIICCEIQPNVYSRVIKYYAAKQLKRQGWEKTSRDTWNSRAPRTSFRNALKRIAAQSIFPPFHFPSPCWFSPLSFVLSIHRDLAKHSAGKLARMCTDTRVYVCSCEVMQ